MTSWYSQFFQSWLVFEFPSGSFNLQVLSFCLLLCFLSKEAALDMFFLVFAPEQNAAGGFLSLKFHTSPRWFICFPVAGLFQMALQDVHKSNLVWLRLLQDPSLYWTKHLLDSVSWLCLFCLSFLIVDHVHVYFAFGFCTWNHLLCVCINRFEVVLTSLQDIYWIKDSSALKRRQPQHLLLKRKLILFPGLHFPRNNGPQLLETKRLGFMFPKHLEIQIWIDMIRIDMCWFSSLQRSLEFNPALDIPMFMTAK